MKRLLLAVATVLLVVPASASAQATSAAVAPDMQVDGALVPRVRASLAAHFGHKRAARIAISARDGAVRVEAPELSLRDRERVEKIVREVPGVTEVIAVVGTVLRPPTAAIVGEKGRLPTTGTAGVVGEKGRLPATRATGIVGEKGRLSRTRVGNIDPQPAAGARVQAGTAAASPRLDDTTLVELARERLVQRLGKRDAAQVRVQARDGVVVVEPVQHAVPDAKRVAEALSGLAGMRRLDNRLQP